MPDCVPEQNRLLAALPAAERGRIFPHLDLIPHRGRHTGTPNTIAQVPLNVWYRTLAQAASATRRKAPYGQCARCIGAIEAV